MSFQSKYGPWALVAGAARGIGRAFCEELAARGLRLVVVDRLADELATLASRLGRREVEVVSVVADLATDDAAATVVRAAGDREIGLLVYCAAHIPAGRFLDDPAEEHTRALAVNARTPMLLAHALAGPMCQRRRGGIVIVSSMAALQGTGWVASYAGTKAFDLVLTESLWWELKDEGVDVLAPLPGATDTEGLHSRTPHIADPSSLSKPEDVAREALDALGVRASHVCGEENRALYEAVRSMSREQAIEIMSSATRLMTEGPKG